tara:strand:- start:184 stop:414 length:231 start_codon:yes stop_codon:yes gene_type:complete
VNNIPGDYLLNETVLEKYNKRSHYLSRKFSDFKVICRHPKKINRVKDIDVEQATRDFHSFRAILNTFFKRENMDAV